MARRSAETSEQLSKAVCQGGGKEPNVIIPSNTGGQEKTDYFTKDTTLQRIQHEKKVVVFMCGLPARGKSFISSKLARYLRWMGYDTMVFNVGSFRRHNRMGMQDVGPEFFDPANVEAMKTRDQLAMDALKAALVWLLEKGGQVAIHDATNSTRSRRRILNHVAKQFADVQVMFVESICNDPQFLEANIRLKMQSHDLAHLPTSTALAEFRERLANYEKAYQPLGAEDSEYSYIKVIDVGKKIVAHKIRSYLPGQICFYLMNLQLKKRPIWLTRHGESTHNVQGRIGGDPELTANGLRYAKAFAEFITLQLGESALSPAATRCGDNSRAGSVPTTNHSSPLVKKKQSAGNKKGVGFATVLTEHLSKLPESEGERECIVPVGFSRPLGQKKLDPVFNSNFGSGRATPDYLHGKRKQVVVWTSTLKRAIETCSYLPPDFIYNQTAMLNEISAGRCENMPYAQIMHDYPLEFLARARDKLRYRYPGSGESYMNVVERVGPLVTEIERIRSPSIVVGHQSTLRALYAYFMNIPLDEVPYLTMPLNTAICLTEHAHGMEEQVFRYIPDQAKPGKFTWEHVPDFCVNASVSDARTIHMASLDREHCDIPEESFQAHREVFARRSIDLELRGLLSELSRLDLTHNSYPLPPVDPQFIFPRNVTRHCGWRGCKEVFESHPQFVAHVMATHCKKPGEDGEEAAQDRADGQREAGKRVVP